MCETFASVSSLYIIPLLLLQGHHHATQKLLSSCWFGKIHLLFRLDAIQAELWKSMCDVVLATGQALVRKSGLLRWWLRSLESNWVAQCVPRSPAPDWIALRLTWLWRLGVIATVLRKSKDTRPKSPPHRHTNFSCYCLGHAYNGYTATTSHKDSHSTRQEGLPKGNTSSKVYFAIVQKQ